MAASAPADDEDLAGVRTQPVTLLRTGDHLGAGDENAVARGLITRLGRKALEGTMITADAKHTSTAFITEADNAGALSAVAGQRQQTRYAPAAETPLPFTHARTDTHDRTHGHGRADTRSLKVLALGDDLRPELLGAR